MFCKHHSFALAKIHLEPEDDCPNQAQCESVVAVDDIVRADVFQMHFLVDEE